MASTSACEEQLEGDRFKKTILIVEDDPSNSEVLKLLLPLETICQTACFSSGSEVLANVDMIQSSHPALFLLDYHLPDMTALDLYERLQAIEGLQNVPTLILSAGWISEEKQARLAQLGLILILKPYNIEELIATITQAIA